MNVILWIFVLQFGIGQGDFFIDFRRVAENAVTESVDVISLPASVREDIADCEDKLEDLEQTMLVEQERRKLCEQDLRHLSNVAHLAQERVNKDQMQIFELEEKMSVVSKNLSTLLVKQQEMKVGGEEQKIAGKLEEEEENKKKEQIFALEEEIRNLSSILAEERDMFAQEIMDCKLQEGNKDNKDNKDKVQLFQ